MDLKITHQTIENENQFECTAVFLFILFAALKINVKQHKNIDFSEKKENGSWWIFHRYFFSFLASNFRMKKWHKTTEIAKILWKRIKLINLLYFYEKFQALELFFYWELSSIPFLMKKCLYVTFTFQFFKFSHNFPLEFNFSNQKIWLNLKIHQKTFIISRFFRPPKSLTRFSVLIFLLELLKWRPKRNRKKYYWAQIENDSLILLFEWYQFLLSMEIFLLFLRRCARREFSLFFFFFLFCEEFSFFFFISIFLKDW